MYCPVWTCSRGIFSEVVFLIFSKVLFLIFSEVVFLSEERECISAADFLHCVARPILSSPHLLCFLLYPCFSSLSKIWILKQTLTPKISQYVFFGIISSDRSSYSDDVLVYIRPLFEILSIYAFLYCYKCHSKSLKQYQCN